MSFKLVAIRPLKGCCKKFRKNLKEDQIYQFYDDYTFKFRDDTPAEDVESIAYASTLPSGFFDINYTEANQEPKTISLTISAVVGRNGSGKSALSEIFLYALFVISDKLRFVHKSNFLFNQLDSLNYDNDLKKIKKEFFAEVYYLHDDVLKVLRIEAGTVKLKTAPLLGNKYTLEQGWGIISKRSDLMPFFYSIVTNYSFYGFNSNEIGLWIKSFFHKNDGYQMPIAINPYRDEGNINVNIETYLTRSRLLANILSIEDYRDINTKSTISGIVLYRDSRKYDKYKFLEDGSGLPRFSKGFVKNFKKKILEPLYAKMFTHKVGRRKITAQYPDINIENEGNNKVLAELYLINKLITIPSRYPTFAMYDMRKNKKEMISDNFDIDALDVEGYIETLYVDRSHVTLKVRQTLNFINYNIFAISDTDAVVPLKLGEMVKAMKAIRDRNLFTELIDYLPPPFFFSEIVFEDESTFTQLSSGEKQQIYSLNSVVYHLKNIDSVHKSAPHQRNLIRYSDINLLFDEIELYFHPDFQKSYISNLLKLLGKAKYENLENINMIFLTHSPMILSDIPNQNILYLDNGKPLIGSARPQKSFGANITDLLADSFFFSSQNKALVGDFAKEKISITLEWLKKRHSEKNFPSKNAQSLPEEFSHHKKIIEMIDEPLVRNKLRSLYLDIMPEDTDFKNKQIHRLQEEIDKLKKT